MLIGLSEEDFNETLNLILDDSDNCSRAASAEEEKICARDVRQSTARRVETQNRAMERRIAGVPTEVLESVSSSSSSGDDDHCFTGFDGYKNLIDSGVDVVLLALPTHFHPIYLKACVEAGKHVFCEKTHAVDVPGVHTVLAAGEVARKKGLSLVSGLAWRYHTGVRETMKRVLDGAIGEIVSIVETCNTKFVQTDLRGEKALRIMKHQAASGIR